MELLEDRLLLSLLGIGDEIGLPEASYDSNGAIVYDAANDAFDADAAPVSIRFVAGARPTRISNPRDFQLHIRVDETGALLGGVEGDDLLIEGVIDINRDGTPEYDGVLLTGEIVAFGYLDSGTSTDQYDFRFTPTGGDLLPFFEGKDIGLYMTSIGSTFTGDFTMNFSGGSQGMFGPVEPLAPTPDSSLAGRVFVDTNNNGVDDGEAGITDVIVSLTGTDTEGNSVNLATVTTEDGTFLFENLLPGTYTLTETQPINYLDGMDTAGSLGGLVGQDTISEIVITGDNQATGYQFAELPQGSLSGFVFEDFNNDSLIDFQELAIEGVTVTLTGTDDLGNAVTRTAQTDNEGIYFFADLRPGTYTLTETQPTDHQDGQESLGTMGGVVGDDLFSDIQLGVGADGMNYNFAERPIAGTVVASGQTATIGFWQNKNGQALLKSLNGGSNATQLGHWLAATFSNIYGANAGENNLAGKTNAEIASFYRDQLFRAKKDKKVGGPAKLDAQIMATAFAVYVTNANLSSTVITNDDPANPEFTLIDPPAIEYGFLVTDYGVGIALFNVGDCGEAFNVADYADLTVMDILLATNEMAVDGVLYDLDTLLRCLANNAYSAINEGGDI